MRNDEEDAPYDLSMAWKKEKPAWDLLIEFLQKYPNQREVLILITYELITESEE